MPVLFAVSAGEANLERMLGICSSEGGVREAAALIFILRTLLRGE